MIKSCEWLTMVAYSPAENACLKIINADHENNLLFLGKEKKIFTNS